MPKFIEVTIGSNEWMLLGDRGLYWHDQRALFVADTHFGKEATFRRNGLPVPRGSTDETLRTISRMLTRTEATCLTILGDMFHARSSLSADVRESLDRFFAKHVEVEFRLVLGNHDKHVGQLPGHWPIETVDAGMQVGDVTLSHMPDASDANNNLVLCGHLHPSIQLRSPTDRSGRLPCFWLHDGCLILPAIGNFTGTHLIEPNQKDRVWMVLGEELMEYRGDLIRG